MCVENSNRPGTQRIVDGRGPIFPKGCNDLVPGRTSPKPKQDLANLCNQRVHMLWASAGASVLGIENRGHRPDPKANAPIAKLTTPLPRVGFTCDFRPRQKV